MIYFRTPYIPLTILLLLFLTLATTGCGRKIGCSNLANVHFLGTVQDLNWFAAQITDTMIEQASPMLIQHNPKMPIFITTFVDNNDLARTNAFGRVIQKAVANQFITRNFSIQETLLGNTIFIEPRHGETILTRDLSRLATIQSSQAVIVGTWSRTGRTLYLSIRAVNPTNNLIISAQSYRLCMDDDILELFNFKIKNDMKDEIRPPNQPWLNRILPNL